MLHHVKSFVKWIVHHSWVVQTKDFKLKDSKKFIKLKKNFDNPLKGLPLKP
jgi:hypothetical protein